MKFFVDQNVPAAVDQFLRARGYEVVLLRERIPTESPDTLVAAVAEANDAILSHSTLISKRWLAGSGSGNAASKD
jgi:predicted nuclease of predicted toxin-antitoxin system